MIFPYLLIAFNSTHTAIKSKTALMEIKPKIVPTLREISESCGMSIMIKPEDFEPAQTLLKQHQITSYKIYQVDKVDHKIKLTLLKTDDYN